MVITAARQTSSQSQKTCRTPLLHIKIECIPAVLPQKSTHQHQTLGMTPHAGAAMQNRDSLRTYKRHKIFNNAHPLCTYDLNTLKNALIYSY